MADNIKKVIEDDGTIHFYMGDLHHSPDGPAVMAFAARLQNSDNACDNSQ